ncbi:MAG: N-6 DNA methylase [Bacteroidia bacterium]|nr:N-6 DNA methylase [Bacteroidia bacterium]
MIKQYLIKILEISGRGDAREESYYSALEQLLSAFSEKHLKRKFHITTLPKKTEAGNPDFRIWDGAQSVTGYIEAKVPEVKDLDRIEQSEQLKRYRFTFPNVILTNFFEFRFYRDGLLQGSVTIARPFIVKKLKTVPPVENERKFFDLLEKFFAFSVPAVTTAKQLATELAKRTKFLKDEVVAEELKVTENTANELHNFYGAFRQTLISGLKAEEFADLYSQTVTYGLFAARTHTDNGFNRKLAYDKIPHTIGILRDVFRFISLGDLSQQMEWTIDDIAEVLAKTDVKKILKQFYHDGKGNDPIIHFYETFLAEYDPSTREKRGVYYTPEPVVSYIVNSLNILLREVFKKNEGFGNSNITVLDPSGGTLTFIAEAIKEGIRENSRYGNLTQPYIKEYVLNNFYAFELMMAPYAIGHLKLSFLLEEWGYPLQKDERFKFFLTNTLEMEDFVQTQFPGMSSIAEESRMAGIVKKDEHILVVLGNPPYSGHSSNTGEWISKEIKAYYEVDGKPLGEKNPKWLQDDYVKFIRFAQWKIDQAGEGMVGFITNHSYLDNPTFRGMRQSLMNSFNEIYILDLHGSSLKKEKCPDGSKDENVFDIMQGVSIVIMIKKKNDTSHKINHAGLWGQREQKYKWLANHNIKNTKWTRLAPKSEFYFFIPRNEESLGKYEKYWKITDIFPLNSVGIVTSRDNFVIDFDKAALKRRIMQFRDKKLPDEIIRQTYDLKDKANWKLQDARKAIMNDEEWEKAITKILYRPFDEQWLFYHDAVIERSRNEVMQHMIAGENLGLITIRRSRSSEPWKYAFITDELSSGSTAISSLDINYHFPLYLYKTKEKKKRSAIQSMMLFEPEVDYFVIKPNLNETLVKSLTAAYKKQTSSEEIFYYIYAVLYSDTYRTKYAEFLKTDFPRIPFTKNYKLFKKISGIGNKLADLHLMKSDDLIVHDYSLSDSGGNKVEKVQYDEKMQQVYINPNQYFQVVPIAVWQYRIGGYQVCEKWLKDRKDRTLSLEDVKHYCRILTAVSRTIEIQKQIDAVYEQVENGLIEIDCNL